MSKKNRKEYIVFGVIAVLTAGFMIATAQIGPKKYYPFDDSKLQIVFLGDSNIANRIEGVKVSERVAEALDGEVYNAAVGGTTAAKVNTDNYVDRTADLFCLYNLSKIIEIEEQQPLLDFRAMMPANEQKAIARANMLTQIEYEEIDYIVISYGVNEYTSGSPAVCGENPYDETTYEGALRSSVERIGRACPNGTIILSSISYCAYVKEGEAVQDGYVYNPGGGYLAEYRDAAKKVASEYDNVVFMDNLELLGIDAGNHEQFLLDGIHFNETAQKLFAEHLVSIITEIESNKDE